MTSRFTEKKYTHNRTFLSYLYTEVISRFILKSKGLGAPGWLRWLSICLCCSHDIRVLGSSLTLPPYSGRSLYLPLPLPSAHVLSLSQIKKIKYLKIYKKFKMMCVHEAVRYKLFFSR